MNPIWLAFLTGLATGGFSCLAVQGGLLTSSLTTTDEAGEVATLKGFTRWRHVSIFLLSKLFAYTVLGFILGAAGSALMLSPKMLGMLQIGVGLFMLATAARILDLHPIFRRFVIEPPRWAYKFMRRQSRAATAITPAVLGAFTVFMPCGVTQATMAVAITSGNPLTGAAIMFAFILGTSPIFFALGASIIELLQRRAFAFVAAIIIGIFAMISINGGIALTGSFYTLQNLYRAATMDIQGVSTGQPLADIDADGYQKVSIVVSDNGYATSTNTLKVNVPTRVTLLTNRTRGCARAFTVPEYGISKILPESGEEVVEFTPKRTGRLAFACSMGMYTGEFNVIN